MVNSTTNVRSSGNCFTGQAVYYAMLIVVAFFVVFINCYVIFTMATNKPLLTKRNAFLASLSVSDLLTGLVAIPLHILANCYKPRREAVRLSQAICYRFISISTMLNILMITVERYVGIIYPLKYQFILTKPRASTVISCTWATSVTSALVSYSWLISSNAGNSDAPPKEKEFEKGYFLITFVAFFLLPLIVMIVLYTKMFRAISKARKSALKARIYLKNSERFKTPSPVNVLVARPRSVSHGSYMDHITRLRHNRSSSGAPSAHESLEIRNRSHSSFGDYLTVHAQSRSRSPSPARLNPAGTMKTHFEARDNCGDSRPHSLVLFWSISDDESHARNANHGLRTGSSPSREPQTCIHSSYHSLPLENPSHPAEHRGSLENNLTAKTYGNLGASERFRSSSWICSSYQALKTITHVHAFPNYASEDVIGSRERSSFARRISDVCASAAVKMRMLRNGGHEERRVQARITKEHRVLLVFVTMLSVFVFTWITWYIMLLDFTRVIKVPRVVLNCFDISRFSVSFLNPILYTFFKKDFRLAFRKTLRRWSEDDHRKTAELKNLSK